MDIMRKHRRFVLWILTDGKKTAMNLRMQCFHPTIHHFRKVREISNIAHRQPRLREGLTRAACRNELHAKAYQRLRKFHEASLILD